MPKTGVHPMPRHFKFQALRLIVAYGVMLRDFQRPFRGEEIVERETAHFIPRCVETPAAGTGACDRARFWDFWRRCRMAPTAKAPLGSGWQPNSGRRRD